MQCTGMFTFTAANTPHLHKFFDVNLIMLVTGAMVGMVIVVTFFGIDGRIDEMKVWRQRFFQAFYFHCEWFYFHVDNSLSRCLQANKEYTKKQDDSHSQLEAKPKIIIEFTSAHFIIDRLVYILDDMFAIN